MRKFLSLLLALVMVLCCIPAVAETADGVYEGTGAGLNGQIKVSVTVSGGKITEVKVLEHSETAGISDPAIEKIPAAIVEAQSADVDIVSGATFTSKGIIDAVKNALNPDAAEEAGIAGAALALRGPRRSMPSTLEAGAPARACWANACRLSSCTGTTGGCCRK